MVRKAYCCDASRKLFDDYYAGRQSGSGKPIFVGKKYQRGHGLGNILGGFERKCMAIATDNGARKTVARKRCKTGWKLPTMSSRAKNLKSPPKKRILSGINRTLMDMMRQSGSGVRAKRSRDIFA